MRKQKGFSLIELLIVVAIILIIAAIAIPNLMRSRMSANESAGAQTVRTLITNEIAYSTSYPTVGYAGNIGNLGGTAAPCTPSSTSACLIDGVLGCGGGPCLRDAYQYIADGVPTGAPAINTDFIIFATPNGPTMGNKDYCSTSDGVPRFNGTGLTPPTTKIA
ncbi:MAG: prepilin-type N-terminal cleavage/methylation domain-containing protein, partial [Acidobacteriia bacterium]|nr:prepilin-type N-terminal cleavage/methylation domain-containing protein [Terriglobia bacterium]